MTGMLTDEELRHAFLDHGPTWIRAQAAAYGTRAGAVPAPIANGFRPFFGADIDRGLVDLIGRGGVPLNSEPGLAERVAAGVDAGLLRATVDTTQAAILWRCWR